MIPETVVQNRRDACVLCKTPCGLQRDQAAHADPCAACPLARSRWGQWDCKPGEPVRGLGDLVHVIALPIARALRLPCVDPVTKKLRPESPCAARRRNWNRKVPL